MTAYRDQKYFKAHNETNGTVEYILDYDASFPAGNIYDWIIVAIGNRKRGVVGGYK